MRGTGTGNRGSPVSSAAVRREALRIAAAFGLYLVLHVAGIQGIVHVAYTAIVLKTATFVLPWVQHFPVVATLDNLELKNLDYPVVLAMCLFAVSVGVPFRRRIAVFGTAVAFLFAASVAAALLQSQIIACIDLQARSGFLLFLPWEFHVLDGAKYLLYDLGMEASTFLLLALTVLLNSPGIAVFALPAPPSPSRRKPAAVLAAAACVVLALFVWGRIRESSPLHSRAHARLGDLFLESNNPRQAEAQYRAAIRGGTTETSAWLNLAAILERRGARAEAEATLRRGLGVVTEPEGRLRLQAALPPGLNHP